MKPLQSLRLVAHRLTERSPAQGPTPGAPALSQPGWQLLFFDVCCLTGLLALTIYVSWRNNDFPAGDPVEYHAYATAFWNGPPRFHAFPKEYPPLSLIPFSLTLFPPSSVHYFWVFALWMGLIVCLSYLWFARARSRTKAITYALYLLIGATSTLLMRFDVLPALVTLGALVLAERKRYLWAYGLLAIGVLLKLYPGLLVPVLMAGHWREMASAHQASADEDERDWCQPLAAFWRGSTGTITNEREALRTVWQRSKGVLSGLGMFIFVTLLGFGIPALINFSGTRSEFTYALARPIQIESVPASLLWLGAFLGFPVTPNLSFNSLNLVGPLESPMKLLSLLVLVGGMLLVCWRVLRGKLSLGQGFVALVAVILASNKLLSPQYLLWILPLVAYVEGFDLLWLTICALTTLIFPFLYHTRQPVLLVPTNPWFLPMIALRNALLVAATVLAVRGRRRPEEPNEAEKAVELGLVESARQKLLAQRSQETGANQGDSEEVSKPLVKTTL